MRAFKKSQEGMLLALEQYEQLRGQVGEFFPSLPRFRRRSRLATTVDLVVLPAFAIVVSTLAAMNEDWSESIIVNIVVAVILAAAMISAFWRVLGDCLFGLDTHHSEVLLPLGYRRATKEILKRVQSIPGLVTEMEREVFKSSQWFKRIEKDALRIASKRELEINFERGYDEYRKAYLKICLSNDGVGARTEVSATEDGHTVALEWLEKCQLGQCEE